MRILLPYHDHVLQEQEREGESPKSAGESLLEAVQHCDTAAAALQQLLTPSSQQQAADPNEAHSGETALLLAARLGAATCVRILLDAGADPHWVRSDGVSALHAACWGVGGGGQQHQQHLLCAQLLLQAGADPNAPTARGITPLHEAVSSCRPAVVEALLAAGAAPNTVDGAGDAPLHLACRSGSCAGCSSYHSTDGGEDRGDSNSCCACCSMVVALLANGADADVRDSQGRTPLFQCTAAKMELLLGAGADVHARNSRGETPLHWQACNTPRCIAMLLGAGADILGRDANGDTPLHKVAGMKSPWERLWRPLLDAGADPNATNDAGKLCYGS